MGHFFSTINIFIAKRKRNFTILREMNTVASKIKIDPAQCLSEVYLYLERLAAMPDAEVLAELRICKTETLLWLLNEVSIVNGEYHVAALAKDVLLERGEQV